MVRAMKLPMIIVILLAVPTLCLAAPPTDDIVLKTEKPSLVGVWKTSDETLTILNKDDYKWKRNGWCMKLPCEGEVELTGTYIQTPTKLMVSSDARKRDLFCDYALADAGKTLTLKCTFRNDPKDDDKITTLAFKLSDAKPAPSK